MIAIDRAPVTHDLVPRLTVNTLGNKAPTFGGHTAPVDGSGIEVEIVLHRLFGATWRLALVRLIAGAGTFLPRLVEWNPLCRVGFRAKSTTLSPMIWGIVPPISEGGYIIRQEVSKYVLKP